MNRKEYSKIFNEAGITNEDFIEASWLTIGKDISSIFPDDIIVESLKKSLEKLDHEDANNFKLEIMTKERFIEIFHEEGIFNNEWVEKMWETKPIDIGMCEGDDELIRKTAQHFVNDKEYNKAVKKATGKDLRG